MPRKSNRNATRSSGKEAASVTRQQSQTSLSSNAMVRNQKTKGSIMSSPNGTNRHPTSSSSTKRGLSARIKPFQPSKSVKSLSRKVTSSQSSKAAASSSFSKHMVASANDHDEEEEDQSSDENDEIDLFLNFPLDEENVQLRFKK